MRIVIFSDIHGNAVALEAVLKDLEAEQIDHLVCLGDVVADGPQPGEVIAHLKALNCPVVMGNMDEWFLDPHPGSGKSKNAQRGNEVRFWGVSQLSDEEFDYLRTFRVTVEIALDQTTDLLCYHGSPLSCSRGISATTPDEEVEYRLLGYHASVLAGGHTHTPTVRHFGDMIIFNPGSVGVPRSVRVPRIRSDQASHPAWAEYGMIGRENGGLKIELRRVPVDVNRVKQAAFDSGMPHAEWWIQNRYPGMALS